MTSISPFHSPFPSSLHPSPNNIHKPNKSSYSSSSTLTITCGPRGNRGPILRGRTLSTEAILAVQSLKRHRSDPSNLSRLLSTTLPRLVKPDLLAALAELQRQDLPRLALLVLCAARAEPWFSPDCALYADMVKALHRSGMDAEIDGLVGDFAAQVEAGGGGGIGGRDLRGPAKLVKALAEAGKGEGVKAVYGLMKRGGCVPDEYLFKFMVRGLRRLGDAEGAEEVERDYHVWCEGGTVVSPSADGY